MLFCERKKMERKYVPYRNEVCPGFHIFQVGRHVFSTHARVIANHGNARNLSFRFTRQKQSDDIKGLKALFERPLVRVPHLEDNNTPAVLVSMGQNSQVLGCVPNHWSHMFWQSCVIMMKNNICSFASALTSKGLYPQRIQKYPER